MVFNKIKIYFLNVVLVVNQILPISFFSSTTSRASEQESRVLRYNLQFIHEFVPGFRSSIYKDNTLRTEAFETNMNSPVYGEGADNPLNLELVCNSSNECPDQTLSERINEIKSTSRMTTRAKALEIKRLDVRSPSQGQCVLSRPQEYHLVRRPTDSQLRNARDDDGTNLVFKNYLRRRDSTSSIRNGQSENLRGIKKLWLNILKDREPETDEEKALRESPPYRPVNYLEQQDFFYGNMPVGPSYKLGRTFYEILPACNTGYTCMPAKSEVEFFNKNLTLHKEDDVAEYGDPDLNLEDIACFGGSECPSGICTPQSKEGLIINWGFSKSKVSSLEMDPDDPYFSKNAYCQPIRRCYRGPTNEFGKLEYDDDYCAPGLIATNDGTCIDSNIALIDLNRVPTFDVSPQCTVKIREASFDNPAVNLEEDSSELYCSIPGKTTVESCEAAGGVWNRVQIKYAKLSRLLLGLEWMWSKADMNNVTDPLPLAGQAIHLNQSQKLNSIMKVYADVRRHLSAVKNATLFEVMEEAKANAKNGNEQSAYLQAMGQYYKLLQATSLAEAQLLSELYSLEQIENLASGLNINYFDEISPESSQPLDQTLYSIKRSNDKAYYLHYLKDGQGGTWSEDESTLEDERPIGCTGIIAGDRGDDTGEMGTAIDAVNDSADFFRTNRNCVQESIYLITNDKHKGGEHAFSENGKSKRPVPDRSKGYLQSYIDFETACFFMPNGERNNTNHVIHPYGDNDPDHEMEDDCGIWDTLQAWSRKNGSGNYDTIPGGSDEITGHMIAYIGELIKHPKPFASYTSGGSSESDEQFTIPDNQNPELMRSGFKRVMLKRQGGLVNPVFPKAILRIGTGNNVNEKLSIRPDSDQSDAWGEVPVVGNWYKVHEGELRLGILEEFKKYIDEIDEEANNCGIEARLNDNIITNEEILSELRKVNPNVTVNQAVRVKDAEFFDRRDLVLGELQEQLYNKIINFHFSDYNPHWGTWALLSSNILATPKTCGKSEDLFGDGIGLGDALFNGIGGLITGYYQGLSGLVQTVLTLGFNDQARKNLTDSVNSDVFGFSGNNSTGSEEHQCVHNGTGDQFRGKPMRGLAEVLSTVYWLAMYKAGEVGMYRELSTCLENQNKDFDSFMKEGGLTGQSLDVLGVSPEQLKQNAESEEEGLKGKNQLLACLHQKETTDDDSGNGDNSSSSKSTNISKVNLGRSNVIGIDVEGFQNELRNNIASLKSESKKSLSQIDRGINRANFNNKSSGISSSNTEFSGEKLDAGVDSRGQGSNSSVSNNNSSKVGAKAQKLRQTLIKAGKNLRLGNKQIDELIKAAGGDGALVSSSETAFKNMLNLANPSANLIGSIGSVKATSGGRIKGSQKTASLSPINTVKKNKANYRRRRSPRRRKKRSSGRRSRRRVSPKERAQNRRILNHVLKNKKDYETSEEDSIFERISKATVRNGYPIFMKDEKDSVNLDALPTVNTQRTIELTPEQQAAAREMELLKKLDQNKE